MFSRRSSWDLRANRLTAALEARRRRGARLVDLTLSNPTRAGLPYPGQFRRALDAADASRYEPEPCGLAVARQAVSQYYAGRGVTVSPQQVVLTSSTSEAYAYLFKLLTDPGDQVLVPQPSYPLFEFLATLEQVETVSYPLRYGEAGWAVDVDRLAAALGPRTRAVVLVHPNNPTGSFVKQHERGALEELAAEGDLALIADEVFADYELPAPAHPRRAGSFAASSPVLTFALSGLSKVMGLPQLKLSWITVQGPAARQQEALGRLEVIADTYLSVNTPVQQALPALLAGREAMQAEIRRRVQGNLALLRARLARQGPARLLACEGGWYAVLEVDADEEELAVGLVEREGVLVHPGYFFDFPRGAHVVLGLLSPQMEEGLGLLLAKLHRPGGT
ncbi:MAG: pyridoxal phosphate-dependent aminotransferase [Candidatus Latescibacterota bacterium]